MEELSKNHLREWGQQFLKFPEVVVSRVSTVLFSQLYRIVKEGQQNALTIRDEILYMEGLGSATNTRKARAFKGNVLAGLEYKHYTDARFIAKNLFDHFGGGAGGNSRLETLIQGEFEKSKSGHVDEEFINSLAYHSVVTAYKERAQRGLTGEWIVYKKCDGARYYLTLAVHEEEDELILRRVEAAYKMDFPFVMGHSQK